MAPNAWRGYRIVRIFFSSCEIRDLDSISYGPRGVEVIESTIRSLFPEYRIPLDDYDPLPYETFISRVVLYEVAARLFEEDIGALSSRENALALIRESAKYGNEVFGEHFQDPHYDVIAEENLALLENQKIKMDQMTEEETERILYERLKEMSNTYKDIVEIKVKCEDVILPESDAQTADIPGCQTTVTDKNKIVYIILD